MLIDRKSKLAGFLNLTNTLNEIPIKISEVIIWNTEINDSIVFVRGERSRITATRWKQKYIFEPLVTPNLKGYNKAVVMR